MKRRIFLLTLALTATLAAGCGTKEPPAPAPSASPTPEAVLPEQPVARRMAELSGEELTYLEPKSLDRDAVAEALNAAALLPAAAPAQEGPLWTVSMKLKDGVTLELTAGLQEDLVTAALPELEEPAFPVSDAALYQLVRHSADREPQVDQEAAQAYEEVIVRAMEDTLARRADDPAEYHDYVVTALTPLEEYLDQDGVAVQLYDFRFALIPRHPELVRWVGAMYPDGDLRVHDIDPTGWLAVRKPEDKPAVAAFLGFSFHWDPEDPVCLDELDSILDRAERDAALTVHVTYMDRVLTQDHDYFQDEQTDYNQELLFRTDRPVTDFRFFALEYGDADQNYTPLEGTTLYTLDQLTPERLLVINTNFPGDMPYRGFAFTEDGVQKSYTLSTSGRDGSLVVAPIQQ